MEFKYVCIERTIAGNVVQRIPVLFPKALTHLSVAQTLLKCEEFAQEGIEISSAGFVDLAVQHCYGESVSLKVKSDKDDARLIRMFEYEHGITERE